MSLARHNLLQDKTRLFLSVAGVALAIMLILILTGFVSGMNLQVSRYLDHAPARWSWFRPGTRRARAQCCHPKPSTRPRAVGEVSSAVRS